MTLTTAPFAPELASADELRGWYEVADAVSADFPTAPMPPYEVYVQQLCRPLSPHGRLLQWDARDNGQLVGTAVATFLAGENSELAIITVRVPPRHRRSGAGTQLLQATLPAVRRHGRLRVTGTVRAGVDGEKWAHALGFATVALRSTQHLDIAATDPARWLVEPAAGFRLLRWTDAAPDELVQGFARARDAIADSPIGASSYQHPGWSTERVRDYEAQTRASGESHRYVAAVDERSGTVAGFTELAVTPGQWSHCRQEDTAVLPRFRGLGLGRAMKANMMRWLTTDLPRLEQVRTVTASENLHMIRVNSQLGYRTDSTLAYVESETGALEALLDTRTTSARH